MVDGKCQERNWVSILRIVKSLHFNAFKFRLIHSQWPCKLKPEGAHYLQMQAQMNSDSAFQESEDGR